MDSSIMNSPQERQDMFMVARQKYNKEVANEVCGLLQDIEILAEKLGGKVDDKALIAAVVVLSREIVKLQDWIIQFKVG